MYKYLERYTEEEKWNVLKGSEVSTVYDVIGAVEDLYHAPNELNLITLKNVESSHADEINELAEDDKEILQDTIHKVIRYARNLMSDNFTNRIFLKERVKDFQLEDTFEPVFEWLEQGDRIVNHWITHGRGSDTDKWGVNMLQDRTQHWRDQEEDVLSDVFAEVSDISASWINFLELNIKTEANKIERHIKHFEDNIFGEWLQDIRNERGLSMRNAANALGLSVGTLQNIEAGIHSRFGIGLLNKIAYVYDIPVTKLMNMYVGPVEPLENIVEEQVFLIDGIKVSSKQRQLLSELVKALEEDDMVEAHFKLDHLSATLYVDL